MSYLWPRAGGSLYSWLLSTIGLPSESVVWMTLMMIFFRCGARRRSGAGPSAFGVTGLRVSTGLRYVFSASHRRRSDKELKIITGFTGFLRRPPLPLTLGGDRP